jgi:hypothetical protein
MGPRRGPDQKESSRGHGIKFFLKSGNPDATRSTIPIELRELAIYDSVCEKYGIALRELLDTYSMAQLVLISHVSAKKFEDYEAREKREQDAPKIFKGKRLNPDDKDNSQAFRLIASGLLS